jgi:hypothetical protein
MAADIWGRVPARALDAAAALELVAFPAAMPVSSGAQTHPFAAAPHRSFFVPVFADPPSQLLTLIPILAQIHDPARAQSTIPNTLYRFTHINIRQPERLTHHTTQATSSACPHD